ncbi:hypothetical protein [Aestuariibaculum sediminum]|uniref:Uncharacterized protein n=1 Tax=Aestuariibaculum sediminum TaxID=2770637 RepID=A0A8J6Q3A3_9FLAO|nr:hypothetical protein [Aestuariibaculum sediminum]MBD0833306.1 hypothetical protein [Aestuariibaculum sediminum]
MERVKETVFYKSVLKELSYDFGNVYIFKGFVISELNRGICFNWEQHGQVIAQDVTCFLGSKGEDVVYIANRIHSYAVVPTDWIKFFKNQYNLRDYFIVSHNWISLINLTFEELFFKRKIKRFLTLKEAVNAIQL